MRIFKHKPIDRLYKCEDKGTFYFAFDANDGFPVPKNIVETGADWEEVDPKTTENYTTEIILNLK